MSEQETAVIIWVVITVALAAVEMLTLAFVALYFALGALAAAVVAGSGGSMEWQLLAFGAVSLVLLGLTRPFLTRRIQHPEIATNVNTLVGKHGIVTLTIDNDASSGQIRVGTEYWTARAAEEATAPIAEGERVRVQDVVGVTARVVHVPSDAAVPESGQAVADDPVQN